jgi:hypothetical protein
MDHANEWSLRHHEDVGRTVGVFPRNTLEHPPAYVVLTASGKSEVLKSTTRVGATGSQIWVSKAGFADVQDASPCTFKVGSARQFRLYWLAHDPTKSRAFVGLVLAILGLALDCALAVGKASPVVVLSDVVIAATIVFGMGLKVVGLFLVFQGVYTSDG